MKIIEEDKVNKFMCVEVMTPKGTKALMCNEEYCDVCVLRRVCEPDDNVCIRLALVDHTSGVPDSKQDMVRINISKVESREEMGVFYE